MANFTTQRFVNTVEIIAYAPDMPGRIQNKILSLYYSPNTLSTLCLTKSVKEDVNKRFIILILNFSFNI